MAINWTKGALLAASAFAFLHAPASAQAGKPLEYQIKKGDTLNDLAREFFVGSQAIDKVMALNKISNPRRLKIGSTIRVPRDLLRYKVEPLKVLFVSGPVFVSKGQSAEKRPIKDGIISEGSRIRTDAKGFITLGGTGGSSISVPSNSVVLVKEAKRYLLRETLDFDMRVLKGRGSVKAPKLKNSDERYNVGTPRAVTAVRGTEFRVAFDEGSELSLTEVTEGEVRVASGGSELATSAGQGISATPSGLGELETLLAAPELINASKTQTAKTVKFQVQPLGDAMGYRTQVSSDAGFEEIIAEKVSAGIETIFEELPDGRLFVRTRGIADSGLEGFSDIANFRRKRVGVAPELGQSPFADAIKFVWLSEGEGNSFGAFQLWDAKTPDVLMVDEVGLDVNGFYVGELDPGSYMWRVATFQITEAETDKDGKVIPGEVIKVWSEPQKLPITE